jgi:hypothetical protein
MLRPLPPVVMAGLDPAIYVLHCGICMDARIKSGHDGFIVGRRR